eukprot:CAMPEP_0117674978 /NCGR_PEP_ID=MMETSP0804-20121206/15347_1 /TAXON_ID=1074897 /ORGANISM="Tetraselmis astigmatica, Strain CCMP880" /LENGTH=130 /DNA_ID=CAMNT_0005483925 /DNA_START=75 /DNA_END=465 /DNA_ORIENTATION=+
MAQGWVSRTLGFGNPQGLAAWAVAGTAAYFLWVRPQQQEAERLKVRELMQEQQDRARGKPQFEWRAMAFCRASSIPPVAAGPASSFRIPIPAKGTGPARPGTGPSEPRLPRLCRPGQRRQSGSPVGLWPY